MLNCYEIKTTKLSFFICLKKMKGKYECVFLLISKYQLKQTHCHIKKRLNVCNLNLYYNPVVLVIERKSKAKKKANLNVLNFHLLGGGLRLNS